MNLDELTPLELLQLQVAANDELRRRKIIRTRNAPLGDYAEWLISEALGLHIQPASCKSYDAVADDDTRYQIKGRRVDANASHAAMGVIRRLSPIRVLSILWPFVLNGITR